MTIWSKLTQNSINQQKNMLVFSKKNISMVRNSFRASKIIAEKKQLLKKKI